MHTDPLLAELKARNRAWAARMVAADPGYFHRLTRQQAPRYLWIGCSDSRVPANQIIDLDPGEVFVHRNIANLASPQDANYLSVLQYAVDVLKVRHVLVVGHYGCGGVAAAVDGQRLGLIDHWLHPIREVACANRAALDAVADPATRLERLCELNVIRQVHNVAADVFVQDAWARGQTLSVHGWVYSLATGLVTDLEVTARGPAAIPILNEDVQMAERFAVGDHVTWNSEAGRVGGTIQKIHTHDFDYKGHTHRASADDPQYEIKSDKTDHVAAHKGSALTKSARK